MIILDLYRKIILKGFNLLEHEREPEHDNKL